MKIRLNLAAILLVLAFLIHSIGGELTDLRALLPTDLPMSIKIELRSVWHLISADFFLSAMALMYIIRNDHLNIQQLTRHFIGIKMLLFGFVFMAVIFSMNRGLFFETPNGCCYWLSASCWSGMAWPGYY